MEREIAKIKIARSKKDGQIEYQEFEVVYEENKNVLQVLKEIFKEQDRTLGFRRYSCNRGVCGSCTMVINGKVKRACVTTMDKEMIIESFNKENIVKDLTTY